MSYRVLSKTKVGISFEPRLEEVSEQHLHTQWQLRSAAGLNLAIPDSGLLNLVRGRVLFLVATVIHGVEPIRQTTCCEK